LPLSVVREHWLRADRPADAQQPLLRRRRDLRDADADARDPFRVVALLGMNDGDYPRSRVPMDFDLMGHDCARRPLAAARTTATFPRALLSAREKLHISWVGRSILDHSERPPSGAGGAAARPPGCGWRLAGRRGLGASPKAGKQLLHALTVEHRLQPFHPAYFTLGGDAACSAMRTEWRAQAATSTDEARHDAAALGLARPAHAAPARRLPQGPGARFFRQRLGIPSTPTIRSARTRSLRLDALENWQLQDELIQAQTAAVDAGAPREPALARSSNAWRARRAAGRPLRASCAAGAGRADGASVRRVRRRRWPMAQALPDARSTILPEGCEHRCAWRLARRPARPRERRALPPAARQRLPGQGKRYRL
jgi:exodeoxyribonuclease V gamma subunit